MIYKREGVAGEKEDCDEEEVANSFSRVNKKKILLFTIFAMELHIVGKLN